MPLPDAAGWRARARRGLADGRAIVLQRAWGQTIIRLGQWSKPADVSLAQASDPIAHPAGMRGVRVGH
jgi:hypothetical protein